MATPPKTEQEEGDTFGEGSDINFGNTNSGRDGQWLKRRGSRGGNNEEEAEATMEEEEVAMAAEAAEEATMKAE